MSLSVSGIVRVTVNLSPLAAAVRSFGVLMIAGDSNVINGVERFRTYLTIDGVAADFGTSAPEYKAAALYFGQTPQPSTLMIGRWLCVATPGMNDGGILSPTQQALANFTAVTNGGIDLTIDGVARNLTALNFSAATNLNDVASIISTALSTHGSCTWNGQNFTIISSTTGVSSIVTAATAGAGTDISVLLQLTAGTLQALIPGFAAETPVACAAALADISTAWYGLMFQASTQPTDDQNLAVSDFIEALDITRIFGVTIVNTNVLSDEVTDDLASEMMDAGYKQSFCQYSQNPYAIASFFGRAFSVDFSAQNSTITLMFKQEPGVTGENLTQNQAATLQAKRCNVFVDYVNDTVIIQYGVMSGPAYFDEIHGLDWFQNAIQTACYNVLYTSTTKVPQTDAGVNQLTNAISGVCDQAVNNGLVAPGTWNAAGFGALAQGQFLKTGYYIYAQPIALQSQSDRDARKAPPIQVAVKLAGAIQSVNVIVDVNR
jgi:hypothetical protein